MLTVKVYWHEFGKRTNVGKLEFFGVPIGVPNGRSLVNVTGNEHCSAQVRQTPPSIVNTGELKAIMEAICRNEMKGRTNRYEWELEYES